MPKDIVKEVTIAAKSLFEQKGFKGTSMVQIAKEAGISIGTLYAYFESKEQLFQVVGNPELRQYSPKNDARKQTILNAALKIFSQKGYHSTTMDEIADSCAYSKTILYQYFSSKEELFAAIFSSKIESFTESQELPLPNEPVAFSDFLRNVGMYFLGLFEDPDRLHLMRMVISEINSFPAIGEIMYLNTVDKAADEVAKQLAVYADDHVIQQVDFKLAARSYLGMLYSFIFTDKILSPSSQQLTKEQIVTFAVPLFVKGLGNSFEQLDVNAVEKPE